MKIFYGIQGTGNGHITRGRIMAKELQAANIEVTYQFTGRPQDKFFDMQDDYLREILLFAKPIAQAIEKSFRCNRCGISVIGLEVPHAHLHLLPINNANDVNFTRSKLKLSAEELTEVQERILKNL